MDHLAQGFEALDGAMQAYRDIGIRATMAPMISDKPYHATLPIAEDALPPGLKSQGAPSPQELIATTVSLFEKWHSTKGSRLHVFFGPSGPQRCTDALLKECGQRARLLDTGFHTHVLESKAQARTAEAFYGRPMLFYLDELGCLSERTSMVHSVWLNDEEIKLAADRGAVAVHNPSSNLLIGSGIAPVKKFREAGVPVALGTDGANVSGSLSMFDSMKLAGLIHNRPDLPQEEWLQPQDVLQMVTHHGPKAFLEKNLGAIAPGQKADLVLLNLEDCALTPLNNPCWQLVYAEPASAVETVLVQGEPVLWQRKLTRISEKRILEEAARRGERIRNTFAEKHLDEVRSKAAAVRKACSL
jgi:cytosine/adenosine deaminase-related metal-dependent hydrolase